MTDTPLVPAQPPEWAVTLTWVCLVLLLVRAIRRRPATAWALCLFFACLVVNVMMVSTARGAIFGKVLGLEVRYLGDLAPTLTLVIAVLAIGLRPTRARPHDVGPGDPDADGPPSRVEVGAGAALVTAALVGSIVSSTAYVQNWHAEYPARRFVQNVIRQTEHRPLVIVDEPVPLSVIPRDEVVNAFERPSQLFRPLGGRVIATLEGNDLKVLDERGTAYPASVLPQVLSPEGPVPDCGYRVGVEPTTVPLELMPGAPSVGDFWWGSISYLGSAEGTVSLSVGTTNTRVSVERGLHTFVFLGSGEPATARFGTDEDVVTCVDTMKIGDLVPIRAEGGS